MRRLLLPGGVVLAGVLLTGCAADASDSQTTATLQDGVVEIAESAASGDHDAALSSLDALAQDVDDALVAGDIDGGRAVAIRDAIDVVRADLETLAAPEPSPTPSEPVQEVATEPPAEEEAPPAPEAPVTEAPEQEAPEPETEAPEPESPEPEVTEPEVTEPENPGNGNQGNGNGNNGNGNNGNGNNGNGNNGNGNGNQGNGNGNQGKGHGKK
ncbi:hypothetical protein GCM10022219_19660 [Microbacterium oryzae]|uniref:hypothetical protein n=1 Tax=Microbacterium oryzae TaxID=743009 RepID=UPI001C12BFFD|nr:hypothetical protein [Microbacterium oryzae]